MITDENPDYRVIRAFYLHREECLRGEVEDVLIDVESKKMESLVVGN